MPIRIDPRRIAIVSIALLCISGCSQNHSQSSANRSSADVQPPPAPLRLAIVEDPALAASVRRLQGEWSVQTGSKLNVDELSAQTLATAKKLHADAIIYSPALLGMLAERNLIRPLNRSWLAGDPLESSDLLQPLDSPEFTWDGQPYAIPLGLPVFVLLYRPDLFELFDKQPPHTWDQYRQVAEFFRNAAQLKKQIALRRANTESIVSQPWSATVEPLAPGWASRLLLARAAAYAKHRDYVSVLFDRETMEPLIGAPPFNRALTELVAAAKSGPQNPTSLTPADALGLFLAGRSAMTITWPSAAAALSASDDKGPPVPVAIAALPGSPEAYNPRHSAWEPRRSGEPTSVPFLGISGRVGSVVRATDSAEAAFRLLTWLSSNRWSAEALPASAATTMFRQSQLANPSPWTGPEFSPTAANQYGQVLAAALRQPEAVWLLRIPGAADYMAALDNAVHAATSGEQTPQTALDAAAATWREITARLGAKEQLEAYRRSLKSEP
jgi:multiple sugar transport system substrate-binding protein